MFPAPILVSGFTSCRYTHTRHVLSFFTAITTLTSSLFVDATRPGSGAIRQLGREDDDEEWGGMGGAPIARKLVESLAGRRLGFVSGYTYVK